MTRRRLSLIFQMVFALIWLMWATVAAFKENYDAAAFGMVWFLVAYTWLKEEPQS